MSPDPAGGHVGLFPLPGPGQSPRPGPHRAGDNQNDNLEISFFMDRLDFVDYQPGLVDGSRLDVFGLLCG